jgi:peptidoglycan hydrolase CwlO-like protein
LHNQATKVAKTPFFTSMGCRFFAPLLALLLSLLPLQVRADELPKFSDQDVTDFVKSYADFVTKYIQAYQSAKTGNKSAFDQVKTQVVQLQGKVASVAEKLKSKPEEVQKYEEFIATYTEKMIDATK